VADLMETQSGQADRLSKRAEATFLETYDCESALLPKADDKWRAMKQIYRPSYVLNHFVHYSTVTKRIVHFPDQVSPMFIQRKPFERRVDEVSEAFMLHTKTASVEATQGWEQRCHFENHSEKKGCPVGIPFPLSSSGAQTMSNVTRDGFVCNCYQHERVQQLVPTLRKELERVTLSLNRFKS